MSLRLAIVGLQHGHIFDLYRRALATPQVEVVAVCEEDPRAAARAHSTAGVEVSHTDTQRLLAEVDCDAVAVGDVYGCRGERLIAALERGLHVISDKPICTRLSELAEIERLAAERSLRVGCMLDMRDSPQFIGARDLVQAGRIGEVLAVSFGGQHPLMLGQRADWYFEPGQHGGTINDIGVHAFDAIPWITGSPIAEIVAARSWNVLAAAFPHFHDAGQVMLVLANGAGVLGDVSYFAPNSQGYTSPFYWRTTLWGREGVLETAFTAQAITLVCNEAQQPVQLPLPAGDPGGYLRAFLHDVEGVSGGAELTTEQVLRAARLALTAQWAADTRAGSLVV
ncbi:MAG: Gfo/Idh/MocA family oxidoreductase [Anaerolineales bacterium]|nr:Gfo/Idh/MocA family oxidoreductase [Anaerolineales bacterium]